MASFNKFKQVLMLAFNCILHSVGDADTCQVTVTQPGFKEAGESTHTVILNCTFSALGCSQFKPQILWFRFFTNKHEDLCIPECTNVQKFKVHVSSENNIALEISDLTVNDSAVYFCGIAFPDSSSARSKQTGGGTVLVKTGAQKHSTAKLTVMTITSSLLFLYSIVVFTVLILDKLKPKLLKKSSKEDQRTENCKISSGRKIFQAIAQELQKQRIIWKMTLFIRTDEYVLYRFAHYF
nr:immunoglobulin superfamily member 6 isoform X1 [Dromaius novaehollandiae]